ncbi:hypothetical protein D3Z52_06935 [Clostridiaceae bacterium]|nr:hypothetical protein [Clostridiaceae bacterium]
MITGANSANYTVEPTKLTSAKTYAYTCKVSYGGCEITSGAKNVTVTKTTSEIITDPSKQPTPDESVPEVPAGKEEHPQQPGHSDYDETDLAPSAHYNCTYGETTMIMVEVQAAPASTTQKARAYTTPADGSNKVALFDGNGTIISEPKEVKNGQATFYIDTFAANLTPRTQAYPLTVRYYGSDSMGKAVANITLTVRYLEDDTIHALEQDGESTKAIDQINWHTSNVTLVPPNTDWLISDNDSDWSNDKTSLIISEQGTNQITYYLRDTFQKKIAKRTVTLKIDSDELALYERSVPSVDSATVTLSSNKENVTYTLTPENGAPAAMPKGDGEFEITGLTPLTEYTYKATCTDTTGHTATTDVTFRTLGKTLASANVTVDDEGLVYDGTAKTPEVTVKIGENALDEGAEYELEYSNNTDAGTATVTIIGKGEYENTRTSETFKIAQKDVTVAVTIKEKTYDGKTTAEIKEVTVPDTVSGETLTYKTGLTAAFEDANAGTDKAVTLSGTPTFEGSVARNYNITLPNDVKGTITPLTLTKFALPGEDIEKTYDGSAVSMSVVEIAPESARKDLVSSWTKNGSSEALSSDPANAGEYTLTVTLKNRITTPIRTTKKALRKKSRLTRPRLRRKPTRKC